MEEFNKIKWMRENPNDDPSTFQGDEDILNDEDIESSYVFKHLNKTLDIYKLDVVKLGNAPKVCIPGAKYIFKETFPSQFSVNEHVRFLDGLKHLLIKTKIDYYKKKNVDFYNSMKPQIAEENKQFLKHVEEIWLKKDYKNATVMNFNLCKYGKYAWEKSIKHIFEYPKLYKQIDVLSYSYLENECSIQMIQTQNILDVGTVAKFTPHTLSSACELKVNSLPPIDDMIKYFSNKSVSLDTNIDNMVENNTIDVIVSLSGLKKLINFTDIKTTWNIPVLVKEVEQKQENGLIIKKRVIYINKPLVKKNPTNIDINQKCCKLLLKTNFCHQKGFKYPNQENMRDNINNQESSEDEDENFEVVNTSTQKKLHQNVSYKLWKLGQVDESNEFVKIPGNNRLINVLIRTKLDACEMIDSGQLQAITVVPKIEYQLNYGGSVATKTELAHLWTILFFKPFSNLYRVRVHSKSLDVVMIEPCNLHKVNNEASTLYNYKPALGLGILFKIFSELKTLGEGQYLLRHEPKHGPFVALLKQDHSETKDTFNLHDEYTNCALLNNYVKQWTPIDVNVILPNHVHTGQMPGLFKPNVNKKEGFKRKSKGKAKGAKKKKK